MKVRNFINVHDGQVTANLDVFIYENDGFKIAYAPALDLMGYGKTIEDAKSSFEIVIEDFFDCTIKNNTLNEYLVKHGWEPQRRQDAFIPPQTDVLIGKNKTLREILNTDFSKQAVPVNYAVAAC